MIWRFTIFFLFLLIPLSFSSAFGMVENFTTDKFLYYEGDTLYVSGNVSSELDEPYVTIVIFNPGKSTFVTLGSTTANFDGDFSTTIQIGGPTWTTFGIYPIQVTSEGSSMEKSIEYRASSTTSEPTPKLTPKPTPEPISELPSLSEPIHESTLESSSTFTTLKFQIPNFPSLDKSPQFYIDRYYNESDYKSWFDSQFLSNSIYDVVSYKATHIDGFPSLDKSPQFYIDRYYNESDYKSWLDSQFPNSSIYNVLGYVDPISVPDWIRNNAEWWSTGEISDTTFVTGIEFMLENNIIMISNIPSVDVSGNDVPDWIRNNAHWWSQDLISDTEFVNSLKFLIQEGIIIIN